MTWSRLRRDDVLREVIAEADQSLDGRLPMDVLGVDQTFRDAQTLGSVLHVRWQATLVAEVERALTERPDDRVAAVLRGWRRTTTTLPGVRLVLDRQLAEADEHSRIRWERRVARQRQWLAVRAGLAVETRVLDEDAVAVGAELEAEGRQYAVPVSRTAPGQRAPGQRTPGPRGNGSLLGRLKAAFVA